MSDATAPKKVAKKAAPKKPTHPKYLDMIVAAIAALKSRKGTSRQAIGKYILANYKVDADKIAGHLKQAIKRGLAGGALKQFKGTGASGSFKLPEKSKVPAKKGKKTVPKKAPKKRTTAKKPAAKKSAAKKATKKAAKKPAKAAKKPAAKKPAAKKAAKKPAAKKPASKKAPKKASKK